MLEQFEQFEIGNPQIIFGGGSSQSAHCDAYG